MPNQSSPAPKTFLDVLRQDGAWMAPLIFLCAVLLFFRLGHYSLWDDEAMTALPALAIVQTGDTSAMVGHNVVAYQSGKHLHNMKDRLAPPLGPYIAAPLLALFPQSTFAARFPFALAGFASFVFVLLWLRLDGASRRLTLLVAAGWLCNVSLLLYSRQSRYYAIVVLLSVLACHAYTRYLQGRQGLVRLSIYLSLIYASFYLAYFVMGACLALDYFIFGRKQRSLTVKDVGAAIVTQACLILPIFFIWNPLGTVYSETAKPNTWAQRLDLFWWLIRDMNVNEFVSVPLIVFAALAAWRFRNTLIIRLSLFVLAYLVLTAFASPQPLSVTTQADVRYLVGLLPVFVFLGALSIDWLAGPNKLVAIAAAVLVFGTNLTNTAGLPEGVRSTPGDFVGELIRPVPEPYTPAVNWIRENVKPDQSVLVLPEYMNYPLMFGAPHAIYAWQINSPPKEQFASLPKIHFKGQVPPDYIVAFGPMVSAVRSNIAAWESKGVAYREVASSPVYWKDLFRPELFWRTFRPLPDVSDNTNGIYFFKRISPPVDSTK